MRVYVWRHWESFRSIYGLLERLSSFFVILLTCHFTRVSCSSDLVLKLGLCYDEKRDCKENVARKQCVAYSVQNGIKFQRWRLLIFFPNSVRYSDFSGKDDTEEEFLGFEGLSSSEAEGKIKVLAESRDGINLRLTGSRANGQSLFLLLLGVHEAKNASSQE